MENENNKLDNILAQNGLNKDTVWGNAKRYFFRNLKPDIGLSPVVSPDSEDTESFLNQESSVVDQESPVVDKHYPTDPIYEKLYQAVTAAEWGGQYTTPETVEKGFFFRASERETEEGSSAYGPLQILGKTFAQNFGDLKHLKQMKKHSINPTPAQGFIDEYKEGAKGALRKRLTSEEKEFVDALIDQANLFLIYGREEDLKGYDEKFDYGGEGNIQELFPDNYKELFDKSYEIFTMYKDKLKPDEILISKSNRDIGSLINFLVKDIEMDELRVQNGIKKIQNILND